MLDRGLHRGQGLVIGKLPLAVLAPVTLDALICAELGYVWGLAVFTANHLSGPPFSNLGLPHRQHEPFKGFPCFWSSTKPSKSTCP